MRWYNLNTDQTVYNNFLSLAANFPKGSPKWIEGEIGYFDFPPELYPLQFFIEKYDKNTDSWQFVCNLTNSAYYKKLSGYYYAYDCGYIYAGDVIRVRAGDWVSEPIMIIEKYNDDDFLWSAVIDSDGQQIIDTNEDTLKTRTLTQKLDLS